MMEYYVITADNHAHLVEEAQDAIDNGWTPQGGICLAMTESTDGHVYRNFAQAMVKVTVTETPRKI